MQISNFESRIAALRNTEDKRQSKSFTAYLLGFTVHHSQFAVYALPFTIYDSNGCNDFDDEIREITFFQKEI